MEGAVDINARKSEPGQPRSQQRRCWALLSRQRGQHQTARLER